MSLAAKDFLFQLQLLVARAGSDLSLRKSLTDDTLSALAANGLKPPAGACFEVTEDKTPCGVVTEGSRFCLNLPGWSGVDQVTFSKSNNSDKSRVPMGTGSYNLEEVVSELEAEVIVVDSAEVSAEAQAHTTAAEITVEATQTAALVA